MKKATVRHVRIELQSKKKAEKGFAPNELTTKTLEKSYTGEAVQTFKTLEQMFESWEK